MSRPSHISVGPDEQPGDVVRDSAGQVVDDDYVARAVAALHRRRPGRPSLDQHDSPTLRFRVPAAVKAAVANAAAAEGVNQSEWLRSVVEDALSARA